MSVGEAALCEVPVDCDKACKCEWVPCPLIYAIPDNEGSETHMTTEADICDCLGSSHDSICISV